ncbi:uncharacterized protein LOC127249286 [Andrographis paniculata]|uniref:uncharacterized protein LOC127249286 n=1 Tax=Andrographis paniculata TaxID=175694 RepID=UPI0021E87540|nr:uncharacterized protein LOC127249286 [Andrographis paniculata]
MAEKSGPRDFSDLILRPIALTDVDDFMVWATDPRVSKFCLWETYNSRDQAVEYIQNQAIPHPWLRAICVDGRAVGTITVTPGSGGDRCRGELGYVLAYDYWGKGIMTRAVEMVGGAIFEELPELQRVEAMVDVENGRSQRVLEKAGFVKEGVLRKYRVLKGKTVDEAVFSIVRHDCSSSSL